MKNLFAENRLVFMSGPETGGDNSEGIKESKEKFFNTDKLYEEFTSYLGEGNNTMMDNMGKCTTVNCFQKNMKSWFGEYLKRVKATGFTESLSSSEQDKYMSAFWDKLIPDLKSGGKQLKQDVETANEGWVKKVEKLSESHSSYLANKILKIVKTYAPYTEVIDASSGDSSVKANPNLPKIKKEVGGILTQLAGKFKVGYKDFDIKGTGKVTVTANLKNVVTSSDTINDKKMEIITSQFLQEAKKKYPNASV